MTKQKNGRRQLKEYDGIAQSYDELMDHVNYKQWAKYLQTIFSLHDKKIKSLIDMSCGTGSLLASMAASKIQLTGSDISFQMLAQAKEKCRNRNIRFAAADFMNLPFSDNEFDAALVLYDSVNYLLKDKDVQMFFNEADRILKNKGLLIFDAVTPYTCRTYFRNYHVQEFDENGRGYDRKSWFDEKKSIQYNEFLISCNDGTFLEKHKQKIRSIRSWSKLVQAGPFADFTIFGDFTFMPAKKNAERVHFVCEKVR